MSAQPRCVASRDITREATELLAATLRKVAIVGYHAHELGRVLDEREPYEIALQAHFEGVLYAGVSAEEKLTLSSERSSATRPTRTQAAECAIFVVALRPRNSFGSWLAGGGARRREGARRGGAQAAHAATQPLLRQTGRPARRVAL